MIGILSENGNRNTHHPQKGLYSVEVDISTFWLLNPLKWFLVSIDFLSVSSRLYVMSAQFASSKQYVLFFILTCSVLILSNYIIRETLSQSYHPDTQVSHAPPICEMSTYLFLTFRYEGGKYKYIYMNIYLW